MYQKNAKRLSELQRLSETCDKTIPKPTKALGSRWIDHKWKVIEILYKNYGAYISHLSNFLLAIPKPSSGQKIQEHVKKWKHACYTINIATYLDALTPIKHSALSLQQKIHDPIKALCKISEFSWTMAKLKFFIDESWPN